MKKITLKKREKKMLIALAVVALLSSFQLYSVYGGSDDEESLVEESTSEESHSPEEVSSPTRSYARSGGSRSVRGKSGSLYTGIQNLEKHNNARDCWVLVSGHVLDITSYITKNQNKEKHISSFCGTAGFEVGFYKNLSEEEKRNLLKQSIRKGKVQ